MSHYFVSLFLLLSALPGSADWHPPTNGRDHHDRRGVPRLGPVENGLFIGASLEQERKTDANSLLSLQGDDRRGSKLKSSSSVSGGNDSGVPYGGEVRDTPRKSGIGNRAPSQLHAGPAMTVQSQDIKTQAPQKADPAAQQTAAWIWRSKNPGPTEKVFFRREFQLPPNITSASVTLACDNWSRLMINGNDLGMSDDWSTPRTYDVLSKLKPGARNVIAVEARNDGGAAGMAIRLRATLRDGKKLHIVSDGSWLCSNEAGAKWEQLDSAGNAWPKVLVVGKMGDAPWGHVLLAESGEMTGREDMTAKFQVAKGFKLERIYRVPANQGSWVAITEDDQGHLLCSDQYGEIYRVTLPAAGEGSVKVEPAKIPLRGAHGLLWHKGVLWVTVNEGNDAAGIWRVADLNGDGQFDPPELIKAFKGRGEHGPHGLAVSPDGKFIYLVAGNHTDMPEMEKSLVSRGWAEDQLLPRRPDARGHARDRMAPGGWVARFTPEGKDWEIISIGYRNSYGLAFNEYGDLFTYDSDMEWDLGMPWYRPTRICHIVPGSEFGWRNGTGKWPSYYEDSMSSQIDIGPGSPTGVMSGAGAKFPAKYQRALFAFDWTFATIYAVHLTPDGGGYRAEREEFLSGSSLPLTDGTIGIDGSMYFLTGGRRADSGLWRVTYTGSEATAPIAAPPAPGGEIAKAVAEDRALLSFASAGGFQGDPSHEKVERVWGHLSSTDRLQRYSARLVLEQLPVTSWAPRLSAETDAWRVIGASIAIARTGGHEQAVAALAALDRLDWDKLDLQQQLNWLRAAGLVFARHGGPDEAARQKVIGKIDSAFPASDEMLNRELCRMLSYLQAPSIVARTLGLMDSSPLSPAPNWLELAKRNATYGGAVEKMIANLPPAQIIHYVYCLRVVKGPWRPDERKRLFSWIAKLTGNSGGSSYDGFIADLRAQTLETCTTEERELIAKTLPSVPPNPFANLPQIQGPGREWTIDEVVKLAEGGLKGADKKRGHDMYQASLCAACHRFGSEGGAAGPDLTSVGGRFAIRDLAEALLEPSKVISDQYAFDLIVRKDGSEVVGKILEEKDEKWIIATSPFDFTQTIEIERNEMKELKRSPVSPMPPGLINRLNAAELKDLLAYLMSKP